MHDIKPPTDNSDNSDKQKFSERRRENRLPAHVPSLLIKKDMTVYTTIINLSSTGIGFLSAIELASDDEVMISFERLDANTMVPVNLKVQVHSCHEVDFEYYIGASIASKSLDYSRFFETIEYAKEP